MGIKNLNRHLPQSSAAAALLLTMAAAAGACSSIASSPFDKRHSGRPNNAPRAGWHPKKARNRKDKRR